MEWALLAITAVIGCIPELLLHELSHCLVYKLAGAKIVVFKPWPHKYEGRFYFGRVMADRELPKAWAIESAGAPLVKATIMLGMWCILAAFVGLWPLGFALWEAIDMINWIQGYIRKRPNDGGRFRKLVWNDTAA